MQGTSPLNPFSHPPDQSNSSQQPPPSHQRNWNNNHQNRRGQHHQPYRSQKNPRMHNTFNKNPQRQNSHHNNQQLNRGGNETWFKTSMLQDPWLPLYHK
ncbi:hypothetical protein PGT21_009340 [Puccinia graminis f. sp. tritici]|uniref:Uncharacterized protein n=1 Tax=Puccinia graminis f. sp. tritici TaxID=56615 RepID=A0A5B0S0S5_PUCGR|nr:hypothetical protein PGT21_009340 [Puccinia graminis f. sp. tritici]KAA1131457.1 hypothetical protein PGTUg99_016593 [Puccinia graminis f. sp. tritici]